MEKQTYTIEEINELKEEIKTTDDPTLQLYNNQDQMDRPRWFVLRFSENITKIHTSKLQ